MPPEEGMYKANCDASVDRIRRRIGFGIIIRNCKGEVMASCAQTVKANLGLKSAKLTAMLKSILFSRDCGLAPCLFEMDEANVVKWILDGDYRDSEYGLILDDIESLISNFTRGNFTHTGKHTNRVAHGLATFALQSSEDTYWIDEFPSCVRKDVEGDMSS
ncbi:hypothetical protein Dsin_000554 [Dipteronia sinensis]|uniref:RNase H type-1 domain-containing protein n=1 Tax=Dipteronia sinensis TaxID=43782 RepID=A0AAE0B294_9ROSI|nr:hypothetical protein Dsin_000554 [Dipteronia sinensis]